MRAFIGPLPVAKDNSDPHAGRREADHELFDTIFYAEDNFEDSSILCIECDRSTKLLGIRFSYGGTVLRICANGHLNILPIGDSAE